MNEWIRASPEMAVYDFIRAIIGKAGKIPDASNRKSHTCRARDAMKVFDLLTGFLPEFDRLLNALGKTAE